MGNKRLLPHTIIPKDLYVLRDADRQLRQVITEMGRPGYVLVARQMGKTNLLLNAKRELETADDLFVYIDLSRHFESDRECFRTMIDTALDTYPVRFANASARIQESRKDSVLPPYKEHENELRALIRSIKGKLVIILDEIDSLTGASFSDRIFAQVRSIYFSRANYSEFARLTYVLSGVVEPNDIIKDKKISPFNIGQKIYLDDFTHREFKEFLQKAGLELSEEVKEQIYSWTSGNPRVTWDLCSAVEDFVLDGGPLSKSVVDGCVQALYLAQFNRAPVDHIRELVADDQEIKSAVEGLMSGAVPNLSDALRSKLYLAGIIGPSPSGQPVKVKNKILEQALSKQWLRDISIQKKGLLSLAVESNTQGRYGEALDLYEQYLATESFPAEMAPFHYLNMGFCAYKHGKYDAALDFLGKAEFDPVVEPKRYWEKQYLSGLCHFQKEAYKESVDCFATVVQAQRRDALHVKSLLNWAAALMELDLVKNAQLARETLQKVLDLAGDKNVSLSEEERTTLLGVAHYDMGRVWEAASNQHEARKAFAAAANRCAPKDRAAILLAHFIASDHEVERSRILDALAVSILSGGDASRIVSPENPLVISAEEFMFILVELASRSKMDLFEKLIEFLPQKIAEVPKTRQDFLYAVGMAALQKSNYPVARSILSEYLEKAEAPLEDHVGTLAVMKYLTIIGNPAEIAKYEERVIACLCSEKSDRWSPFDFQVITVTMRRHLQDGAYSKVLDIAGLVKSRRGSLAPDLQADYAIIHYCEIKANDALGFSDAALAAARAAVALIRASGSAASKPMILKVGETEAIKDVAESYLATYSRGVTVRNEPGFRANEWVTVKYPDGTTKKTKFKKVKEELALQRCVILKE